MSRNPNYLLRCEEWSKLLHYFLSSLFFLFHHLIWTRVPLLGSPASPITRATGVKPRKQEMHEVSIAQLIVFLRCIIVTSHHNSHNSLPAVPSSSKSHKPTGSRFFADFSASKRQKADHEINYGNRDSLFVKENISNRTENEWIRQKRKKNWKKKERKKRPAVFPKHCSLEGSRTDGARGFRTRDAERVKEK